MNRLDALISADGPRTLRRDLLAGFPCLEGGLPPAVAVVGASPLGWELAGRLLARGVRVAGIYDDNPAARSESRHGLSPVPVEDVAALGGGVPVALATQRLRGLDERLRAMGVEHRIAFPVFSVLDAGAFPPHPFFKDMLAELWRGRRKLAALAPRLADDASRQALETVLAFRLSLDPGVLPPVRTSSAYFCPDVVAPGEDEVMLDGGAYDGDTVLEFSRMTGGCFRRIVALEPSAGGYAALAARFAGDSRIVPVRGCLHHRSGEVRFDDSGLRDAAMAKDGGTCPALRIDDLPQAVGVTCIKLNIEGAEPLAITGASRTIRETRPKLSVAAYHKPRHLWTLAGMLDRLVPDYELRLRHHGEGVVETVLYACASPGRRSRT